MPTPTKGHRLGGSPAHERHILANLATALFQHGRITTTEAKARRLQPVAERLITFAKRGDLHARRQVLTVVTDKSILHTLFTEIGPSFATRPGGYTRITKIGPRKGDNAPMAVIELVAEETQAATPRRRRPRRARTAGAPVAQEAAAATAAAAAEPADDADLNDADDLTDDADVPEEAAVGGEAERAAEPIDPDDAVRDDAEATDVGPAGQTADAEADEASAHATPEPEDGEHV